MIVKAKINLPLGRLGESRHAAARKQAAPRLRDAKHPLELSSAITFLFPIETCKYIKIPLRESLARRSRSRGVK